MTMSKKLVNSIITIALMLIGFVLPPFGNITEIGMPILGIFLGVVYGWCFVSFVWPSLLGMLLLPITGYGTFNQILSAGFGDTSVVLNMFLLFIFFGMIGETGVMQWLAKKILNIKFLQGKPWLFTFILLFVVVGCVGGMTNCMAMIIMMWAIFKSIAQRVGYEMHDRFVVFVNVGVGALGVLSLAIWPFTPYFKVAVGLVQKVADISAYNLNGLFILMPLLAILATLGYLFVGKFILKLDASKLANYVADEEKTEMTQGEKTGLFYLSLFLVIIFLQLVLPKTWKLAMILNDWGTMGIAFIGLAIAIFLSDNGGSFKTSFGEAVKKGVSWDIIVMVIASMPICAAMESDAAGIISTISLYVMPIIQSMNPTLFVFLVVIIFAIITQFAHNLILMIAFLPVLTMMCTQIGVNPLLFGMLFFFGLQIAIATPGASVQGALVFGNSDIPRNLAFLYGWIFVVVALVLGLAIGYPVGTMVL